MNEPQIEVYTINIEVKRIKNISEAQKTEGKKTNIISLICQFIFIFCLKIHIYREDLLWFYVFGLTLDCVPHDTEIYMTKTKYRSSELLNTIEITRIRTRYSYASFQ